jgi:Zn-finger nucleic acid-binding protein
MAYRDRGNGPPPEVDFVITAYTCPRCSVMLDLAPHIAESGARMCPRCKGVFIEDVRTYRELEAVARPTLWEIRRIPDDAAQLQPLACPRCGSAAAAMHKGKSERDKHVVVDVCPKCGGCWLDGGELDAIQRESFPQFLGVVARWLNEA